MSYSFTITADTKVEAKQKVAASIADIAVQQPAHTKDSAQAIACAEAFLEIIGDPHEGDEIVVSMHGSVGWHMKDPDDLLHANVGVNASIRNKAK